MALLVLIGCSPASDRLPITGAVSLNGVPLDLGTIRLSSRQGDKILVAGATIKDGEYSIPQEKGLPPGTYQVEISAPDAAAPLVAQRGGSGERGAPPSAPERIPPEYNVDSQHTIEVIADGQNHFEFAIASKQAS